MLYVNKDLVTANIKTGDFYLLNTGCIQSVFRLKTEWYFSFLQMVLLLQLFRSEKLKPVPNPYVDTVYLCVSPMSHMKYSI